MWTNERCTVSPYGEARILETLHEGRLFHVFRASLAGREVCLKAANPAPGECYDSRYSGGSEFFGSLESRVPTQGELAMLLTLEASTIRATRGRWNHHTIGSGVFDAYNRKLRPRQPDDPSWHEPDLQRFWPVTVMPLYSARPLSTFPAEDKRGLFVRLLPSLWTALCVQPHADLDESNILIDEPARRFILIDPGVCAGSFSEGRHYAHDAALFTTNPRNYPLLFPHGDLLAARNMAACSLDEALQSIFESGIDEPIRAMRVPLDDTAVRDRPTAADQQALAMMHYRMWTGKELLPVIEILNAPAWYGNFGTYRATFPQFHRYRQIGDAVQSGAIRARLAEVEPLAAQLIEKLVGFEIRTRAELEAAIGDQASALQARRK